MSEHKDYLGDGVYVDLDDSGDVVLTTENGFAATNRIVMERSVIEALRRWLKRVER